MARPLKTTFFCGFPQKVSISDTFRASSYTPEDCSTPTPEKPLNVKLEVIEIIKYKRYKVLKYKIYEDVKYKKFEI